MSSPLVPLPTQGNNNAGEQTQNVGQQMQQRRESNIVVYQNYNSIDQHNRSRSGDHTATTATGSTNGARRRTTTFSVGSDTSRSGQRHPQAPAPHRQQQQQLYKPFLTERRIAIGAIIFLSVYLLLGIFVYAIVQPIEVSSADPNHPPPPRLERKITLERVVNAVYFCVVTFTTIGYGDQRPPVTVEGRIIASIFLLVSAGLVGGVVLSLIGLRGVDKAMAALIEEEQEQEAVKEQLFLQRSGLSMLPVEEGENGGADIIIDINTGRRLNRDAASASAPAPAPAAAAVSSSSSSPSKTALPITVGADSSSENQTLLVKNEEEENEGGDTKTGKWNNGFTRGIHRVLRCLLGNFSLCLFVICVVTGTAVIAFVLEKGGHPETVGKGGHWSIVDAVYWLVMTATTVGYGDLTPRETASHAIACVIAPMAIALFARSVNYIVEDKIVKPRGRAAFQHFLSTTADGISAEDFEQFDFDNDNRLSPHEYIEYVLVKTGKIQPETFRKLRRQFALLDTNGSGYVERKDASASMIGR